MKNARTALVAPLLVLVPLAGGCGESGSRAAGVVQAATQGAAEVGQKLAEKATELARMAPEEVRVHLQDFMDTAARELREVRDSEAAARVTEAVQKVLERLVALEQRLSVDLGRLRAALGEMGERFAADPRVVEARKKLESLMGSLEQK